MLCCTLRLMLHGQLVMNYMIIAIFLCQIYGVFLFSLLMHSSTVVFIELHPVCDYFFIKLWFLAIFVTLLNLPGLSFLISKIRDFEWMNSWGTFYFQSTIFQTGTESMPLSDFKNMFCILSSRHLMRSVPKSTLPRHHLSHSPEVDINALITSLLFIYIFSKCFQFRGHLSVDVLQNSWGRLILFSVSLYIF